MENKLVIIVEDNPDDRELIVRAFKKNSIRSRLVVLNDGVEAIQYLNCEGAYKDRDIRELPNLIILDIKLPKIDGKEVLKYYRANSYFKNIPIVILSSSSERKDIFDTYSFGANSYIKKNIDFSRFLDIINTTYKYWIEINESL
ncbi:MAG: response regulator [Bacteroidota bacterium]